MEDLCYIQLKKLEDLVRLVSSSQTLFLQHIALNGKHIYFIQSMLSLSKPMVYLYQDMKPIEKKYIIYNRFKDEVAFSDIASTDGQSVNIAILEIENTNLLSGLKEIIEK